MTQKRKAELQRKLSMAPVAKPPSNLAERIKADIPEYLSPQRERERVNRSLAFSLRVAASIILLVTSAFLTIELLSRDERALSPAATPAHEVRQVAEVAEVAEDTKVAVAELEQKALLDGAETQQAPLPQVAAVRRQSKDDVPQRATAASNQAPPAPPLPPAAPPAAPVAPVEGGIEGAVYADAVEVTAARPEAAVGAAAESRSFSMAPSAKNEADSSFGISTDRREFGRLKKMLDRGDTPAPGNVDVAALVNHFAGPPAKASSEVHLEVEASRAPLADDRSAVIRYTIDMPAPGERARVTRANLSIALEMGVIDSYRTVGGARPLQHAGGVLADGESATGLVEVKLREGTRSYQRVAMVLLDYVSPVTGEKKHAREVIYAHDLDRGWTSASRRHRLATLSAVWGESLTGSRRPLELARTAARLAEEAPGDERAQELAAATASSRPRNSSPTGSGR